MPKDIHSFKTSLPIKNYGGVVHIPGTGHYSFDSIYTSQSLSSVEEKYENSFINTRNDISRLNHYLDVKILSGATTSESVNISKYSFGSFQIQDTFTGPTINFETKMRDGNSFQVPKDKNGALLTGVAASTGISINFPYEVLHNDVMRFASISGQVNDCTIKVLLKG